MGLVFKIKKMEPCDTWYPRSVEEKKAPEMLSPASPHETETATTSTEAPEAPTNDQDQDQDQDQDAQAEAAQAGRAIAVVAPVKRKIVPVIENERLCRLLLRAEDGSEIRLERPTDRTDVHYALWTYADKQRRSANERAEDSQRFAAMMKIGNDSRSHSAVHRIQQPPAAANLQPAQLGVAVADTTMLQWQTKQLPDDLREELETGWVLKIEEHTHDKSGRAFAPGGEKQSSFCGAFPHAITKPRIGPHRDQDLYLVGATHDINLRISLHRRPQNGEALQDPVSEGEVLQLLRERLPKEEIATWGSLESSMVFYAKLQFAQSVADSAATNIDTNPASAQCAFRQAPENGKLLIPSESAPYSGGFYEQMMSSGEVQFQFKTNGNVTTSNLSEPYHARKFRLAVWCLNPYLNSLTSFRALSIPFNIKSTLHNSLKRAERYVSSDGPNSIIIPCPIDQISHFSSQHRKRRKRKTDEDADEEQ